jgi:hypothetical protein
VGRTPGVETFGQGETGLDGWWTIRLGSAGVVGVVLYYSAFAIPAFRAWRRAVRLRGPSAILLSALICMLAVRMIDLLINGWWNCFPVFLAGVLTGVTQGSGERAKR